MIEGDRLADILAEEEAEAASDRRRAGLIRAAVIGLGLLTFLPGLLGVAYIYFRYGREPGLSGYDREYEQEPPSELPPAEVGALLSQGQVDERQFTATLFDLIRKKVLDANPVKVPIESWMGLRTEIVDDLELSYNQSHGVALTDTEEKVVQIVNRVLDGQPRPLHEFRKGIREDAAANAESYSSFRNLAVTSIIEKRLFDRAGRSRVLGAAGALVVLAFVIFFLIANIGGGPASVVVPLLIVAIVVNGAILAIFGASRRGYVRRSKEGALEAARWTAFRNYLKDFSRLEEAPPISLALWDRFLVYAIAFGVAEEVLEAARLRAPAE
ncbi:MAG: DUF2207 family protein, partial [bacterium]